MFFSDKLRLLRTQANLSQEDLADELHVSRQSVSKWESGISFPEIEKLISISALQSVNHHNSLPIRSAAPATIFMFPWMPC